jgi:L-iditol 2-dehydrogenase
VGLNTVIFSRLSGAGKIIVLGAPDLRLELAKEFGADLALDIKKISERQRIEAVKDATEGRGGDVVIEASGNPRAVWEGLQMTRDNGIYVVVGQYTDHGPVEINPHLDINKKHIDIRGCWGCDFSHLYKAIQVMNRHAGDFPWEKSITGFYGLSEAQEALEDVESLKVVKAVIDPRKKG